MTIANLREMKNTHPFESFVIHMADGKSFEVSDPEDLVIRKDWNINVIVLRPRGQFSFVYLKNITHITGQGKLRDSKAGAEKRARVNRQGWQNRGIFFSSSG